MLKIFIQGLKDGLYDVDISSPVDEIPGMSEEYFGDVTFSGEMRILGKRYTVSGNAVCKAKMVCDISLIDFEDVITVEFKNSYLALESMTSHKIDKGDTDIHEYFIKDDEKFINISEEVREELFVNLPMKRIAPEFRDKSFEDIHPELSVGKVTSKKKKLVDEDIDDRWGPLKSLKFKRN